MDPQGYVISQVVRTQGNRSEALAAIRHTCREVSKEVIGMPKDLEADYIDDYLDKDLTHEKNIVMLVLCFMVISILISAMGLFAMSDKLHRTAKQTDRLVQGDGSRDKWRGMGTFQTIHGTLVACRLFRPAHQRESGSNQFRVVL